MATASHGLPAGARQGALGVKLFHPLQRDTASATSQGKARGWQNVTYCEPKPYLLHGQTIPFGGQKVWFCQATLWATPFCTFISIRNALRFLRENLRHEAQKAAQANGLRPTFRPHAGLHGLPYNKKERLPPIGENLSFVVLSGFEPLQTEPKPVVLPLHHRTKSECKIT